MSVAIALVVKLSMCYVLKNHSHVMSYLWLRVLAASNIYGLVYHCDFESDFCGGSTTNLGRSTSSSEELTGPSSGARGSGKPGDTIPVFKTDSSSSACMSCIHVLCMHGYSVFCTPKLEQWTSIDLPGERSRASMYVHHAVLLPHIRRKHRPHQTTLITKLWNDVCGR